MTEMGRIRNWRISPDVHDGVCQAVDRTGKLMRHPLKLRKIGEYLLRHIAKRKKDLDE